MNIDLAISPCPNDTFIFYHFIQPGFITHELKLIMRDVEELNQQVLYREGHTITKISYLALAAIKNKYRLLSAGGAMGRGCGPLFITTKTIHANTLSQNQDRLQRILIPGRWTTANLLLHIFLKKAGIDTKKIEFIPTRYDLIIKKLKTGDESCGIIIHEERFNVQDYRFYIIQDLGKFWEELTGLPLPLGAIVVRKEMPVDLSNFIEGKICESIQRAKKEPGPVLQFVKKYSQSMHDDIIKSHIDLYVNQFSENIGVEGKKAIDKLFQMADETELLDDFKQKKVRNK